MPRSVRSGRLEDLDDGCLLEVLKHLTPLPDLFLAARVCQRFRRLAGDARLWKLVTGAATPADAAGGRRLAGRHGRRAYATLQAAVAASRPGDTIELEAAQVHEAADIAVRWPLRLRGNGAAPEDTVLVCPRGADAALVFSASGALGNLSVHSGALACLVHHRGRVTVQGCVLTCHASHGLGHLFAPLVTLARAPSRAQRLGAACTERAAPRTVAPPLAAPPALAVRVKREDGAPGGSRGSTLGEGIGLRCSWGSGAHLLPAGGGVLTVVETRILGSAGSQAVRAAGSGVLRGVRAIPLLRGTLFWFVVDSAAPGGAPARSAPAQLPNPDAGSPNPGSAGRAPPAREPGRAQEQLGGRLPQPGCSGRGSGEGGEHCDAAGGDGAQQRSKAWHAARHRAVAACECEDVVRVAQAKRQRWE